MPPAEDAGRELLLLELGRINSELAAQRRLSAMVAHDLATPTQVILGLAEVLLEQDGLDAAARTRVEQLHRSAETMTSLVNDLSRGLSLDVEVAMELARIDMVAFVSSVADRSRLLSVSKQMRIELTPYDGPTLWIDGDKPRLERAMSNLIGNAIKFSPQGSTVTVGVDRVNGYARVTVRDQGPGISSDGLRRIFDAFHREEKTAHLPGLGLGLHITRQIAENHGGNVSAVSEPGEGATFVLHLPLVHDELTGLTA